MSTQPPGHFPNPPPNVPAIPREPTGKSPPPAALDTQLSRRRRGRSSLGSLVSRILPSRRPERGHTARSEYKDDGPLSATELVFGLTGPEDNSKVPVPNNADATRADSRGIVRPKRYKSIIRGGDSEHGVEENPPKPSISEGQAVHANELNIDKKRPGISLYPQHFRIAQDGNGMNNDMTPHKQHPEFRLPSFKFVNDALGFESQKQNEGAGTGDDKSKSQQMFAAKKARRDQRKSLLESGDFLGVQGANPRTGYWDVSTATSSSDPSQTSYETRRRLEQQAKEVEEQRAMFEETQTKYNAEVERAQNVKAKKEAEKMELKKWHLKLKQRKRGRWNAGENGWSSVAEPDLSPIGQSLAGTPVKGS